MKTMRINSNNQSIESVELNEQKFQVWQTNGSIMQVHNGEYFFISNSYNFKWATNFHSFDEAKKHADILIDKRKRTGGLKIFSGNKMFAHFSKGEWIIYPEPKMQLL